MPGGGGGGTTTQRTELDPVQRRALTSVINKSESQFNEPLQFFPGDTLADQDFLTRLGQSRAVVTANRLGGLNQNSEQALTRALNADLVGDPRTQAAADAAVQPLQQRFEREILPQIGSAATASGAFGGSRQAIAEGQAAGDFAQSAVNARANIFSDALRAGQQAQLQGLQLAPQVAQQQLLPSQILQQTGAQREDREQREIDARRERFEFNQFEPESRLDRFASRVSGINLGGVTTSTTSGGGGLFGK